MVPEWSKPGAHVALQMLEQPAPSLDDTGTAVVDVDPAAEDAEYGCP